MVSVIMLIVIMLNVVAPTNYLWQPWMSNLIVSALRVPTYLELICLLCSLTLSLNAKRWVD